MDGVSGTLGYVLKGSNMGTFQKDAAASREAARVAADDLNTLYEDWWQSLDGPERRVARSFLGFGIPDACADSLAAAGIPQVSGLVVSGKGLVTVRLPRTSLTAFIAAHPHRSAAELS